MFLCMSVACKQLLPKPGHSSILLRKESSAPNHLDCRFFFSNKIFSVFQGQTHGAVQVTRRQRLFALENKDSCGGRWFQQHPKVAF